MRFGFEQDGPVDAKEMARPIKGYPRQETPFGWRLVSLCLSIPLGALFGAGGVGCGFFVLRWIGFDPSQMGLYAPIGGGVFAFGVWTMLGAVSVRSSVPAMLKRAIYSGNTRWFFEKEGLYLVADNAKRQTKWPAVTSFKDTGDGFFFYSGAFVYVLPQSVFGDADRDVFVGAIDAWRAAA